MQPRRATAQSGFSLLELMVAVALLSLALIPLLVNQGTSGANALRMHERTLAFLVADNLLLESLAMERAPTGQKTGNISQGGIRFGWQRDVDTVPDSKLSAITVRVYQNESGKTLAQLKGFHPGRRR